MGGATFWQAAGAVVTALGVLVALWIALRGEQLRRREQTAMELAEARTFRVRGTGGRDRAPTEAVPSTHELVFYIEHVGTAPVYDVFYEAWWGGADLSERAPMATHRQVARPGEELGVAIPVPDWGPKRFTMAAWRVRWSDRFGNQWMVHEATRAGVADHPYTPEPYAPGSSAPRYAGIPGRTLRK